MAFNTAVAKNVFFNILTINTSTKKARTLSSIQIIPTRNRRTRKPF